VNRDFSNSRLAQVAPEFEVILTSGTPTPALFSASEISRETLRVSMRDGVRLATDLYLPPQYPAPAIAMRTPYGRAAYTETFLALAQCGYIVIAQDCRGTGDSEPDEWEYSIYEPEDSFDFVEWVTRQEWFGGFLGGCGGSYDANTQWEMAKHPRMSAIAPEVGGLIAAWQTVRFHNLMNAYSRSVGKGRDKVRISYRELEREMLQETLATGYFNEPLHAPFRDALLARYPELASLPVEEAKHWLWEHYCALGPAKRAELIKLALGEGDITMATVEAQSTVFGHHTTHGYPSDVSPGLAKVAQLPKAPALMINGWYDWGLGETLATWELLLREAPASVSSRCRLLITPSAHNTPGYQEGEENHPELKRHYRTANIVDLLLRWFAAVRDDTIDTWPKVIYYLMGANEWHAASTWPPAEAQERALHLGANSTLTSQPPAWPSRSDGYTYDPLDPTPTVGGSVVSHVYPPGSVDVSKVQQRSDVLAYTTAPLDHDLDVVGPLRLILYASSSAVDTDFAARLSDVFPDGRAIQLQSGILRARYRDPHSAPQLLEPDRIYRFEIDMWATANRFKAGHRLRLDISSADFPKFDRNANLGGEPGPPIPAMQTIFHDPEHPSHLLISVIERSLESRMNPYTLHWRQ
jgi:predicted acyl esterase